MRFLLVVLSFQMLVSTITSRVLESQTVLRQLEDVVHLKDGSIIRGTIVEQIPGQSVLIRTRDGNQFRYHMDLIAKLSKEEASENQPVLHRALSPRSVGKAVAMSVVIPGAGQAYNGEWVKALSHMVAVPWAAFNYWSNGENCSTTGDGCSMKTFWAAFLVLNSVWSIIDAGISAKSFNARLGDATVAAFVRPQTTTGSSLDVLSFTNGQIPALYRADGIEVGARIWW